MKFWMLLSAMVSLAIGFAPAQEPGSTKPTTPTIRSIRKAADPVVTVAAPIKLKGTEYDLLVLDNYKGLVTWDVTTPDGNDPPVKWYELKPKQVIIGLHSAALDTDSYEAPDQPAVALFGKFDAKRLPVKGKALIVAYGVVDNKAKKLASKLIECNQGAPDPTPTPVNPIKPVLPDGKFGLAKFAYDTTVVTVAKDSLGQAKGLAAAYRGVASDKSLQTPTDVLKAAKTKASAVTDASKWDAFGVALQDKLYALYEAKSLKVAQDFKDALVEIAQGLEQVGN